MIATARHADELKAAAGVKTTGRKSAAHVYSYSLAWHPDEARGLSPAEMQRAADASLKAIGADHLQAVIVAHHDTKHPHVHVIVNRVDPNTGRMFSASNDRLRLSEWAQVYERERGKELCPARSGNIEARQSQYVRAKSPSPSRPSVAFQGVADDATAQLKARGDNLARSSAEQRLRHRDEWIDLSVRFKIDKEAIWAKAATSIADRRSELKREHKPQWAALFKEQRKELRMFDGRERRLWGKLENAVAALRYTALRGELKDRGFMSAAVKFVMSRTARLDVLKARHERQTGRLGRELHSIVDKEIQALNRARTAELRQQREVFASIRAAIIERQSKEQAASKQAWRDLKADRESLSAGRVDRRLAGDAGAHFQTAGEIRAMFAQTIDRRSTRTRSRGRHRTRSRTQDDAPKPPNRLT